MRINRTRNEISNQIFSFEYNTRLNTNLNCGNIDLLVKRSIIKGYFDKVFFYKILKKESRGFNNIFFSLDKKNLSLKAFFIYGNSKYNIESFDIITLNDCVSSFNNLILKNETFKNVFLYETFKTPYLRKYKINNNVIKTFIEHILSTIKIKKELFFKLVNENFRKIRIKDIY